MAHNAVFFTICLFFSAYPFLLGGNAIPVMEKLAMGVKEINWIEALADYVNIYTIHGRYTILSTMKMIEQKLPHRDFARVHRSYIVRLDKIKEIEDNAININDNIIPISRSYKENLMERLNLI
jgi:DNA-binding LytR/AlgR family response regulator